LVGSDPATEPHARLKAQSGHRLPFGWREVYVCLQCRVALQRLTTDPDASKAGGEPWMQVR
jgi:hypothetical protein